MQRKTSVLMGKDYEAIEILLSTHLPNNPSPCILDCTYNTGKMWKNCRYQPSVTMDICAEFPVDVVGDFTAIPFGEGSFDVVVFDPPHLPNNAGSVHSSKIWESTYGITGDGKLRSGDNVSQQFIPFLLEARRVLTDKGVILAKIADLVHNHRYQWQQVDFINAVGQVGMTPCDLLIKCDPAAGRLQSSKWSTVKHLRKAHCYWIVVRKGKKCEG
jgi:hypothetical protein